MNGHYSVVRRLFGGLAIVGGVGTLFLLLYIAREHRQSFQELGDPASAQHAIHELTEHVLVPILVFLLPIVIASIIVIRRALHSLTEAAAQLQITDGHQRRVLIDDRAFPAEVMPFADAVNLLLGQLDRAASEHEAFAADVAHELRTPLAVLSLELEVLDHPDAPRLRAEVMAMRRLIEQLMLLARVDAQFFAQSPPTPVRIEDVAADVISMMAPGAIADGKTLSLTRFDDKAEVMGHREAIAAALRNLVENALRVTPTGGSVTVITGPGARLRVQDGGSGLTPEKLAQLVRRHHRADHASTVGAGLGLAIVARIMAAHGGTLKTLPDKQELVLDFSAKNEGTA